MLPPYEYTTTCPYKQFEGTTERDLALYILSLQKSLDSCNLKQTQEAKWFNELQVSLKEE